MEKQTQCILVLMGSTPNGDKELIAIQNGFRESEQSWFELLQDVKQRGLEIAPKLAVGDGALGFWKALHKVYPTTRVQRCWFHKMGNVLNKLPKSLHGRAKAGLPVADDGPDDGVPSMPQRSAQVAEARWSRTLGQGHRRRDGGSRCVRGHTQHLTIARELSEPASVFWFEIPAACSTDRSTCPSAPRGRRCPDRPKLLHDDRPIVCPIP
jgi:hypothetical protein